MPKTVAGHKLSALKAPFPWFGGKRRVADIVWERFGNVPNYVEPFFGSGAVMLARPPGWPPRNETVNDIDCMVANFWRSIEEDPEEVAYWADWPVNEADLHARHRWLHEQMVGGFIDKMHADVAHWDPQIAGWWVWGISAWIGDGWCRPHPSIQLSLGKKSDGSQAVDLRGREDNRCNRGHDRGSHCHRKQPELPKGGSGKGERRRPALKPAPGVGVHSRAATRPDEGKSFKKQHPYGKGTLWQARPEVKGQGVHRKRSELEPNGLHKKRPNLGKGARGVTRKRPGGFMTDQAIRVLATLGKLPDLGRIRKGIHRKQYGPNTDGTRPNLQKEGVNRATIVGLSEQLPDIAGSRGASGRGINTARTSGLIDYMARLHDRLRYVRVCCGEWHRILGPSPTIHIGTTAVFLDPPYGSANRGRVYAHDSLDIAADVQAWCIEHTDEPKLRIALCGYEGEHNNLEALGWIKVAWKASGGYGARNKDNKNADRERIWFSPHCLDPAEQQGRLF